MAVLLFPAPVGPRRMTRCEALEYNLNNKEEGQ